mgnify:CR=1 FL=1
MLHRRIGPGSKTIKLRDLPLALAAPAAWPVTLFSELTDSAAGGQLLHPLNVIDAMEFLLDKMKDSKTNEDFFDSMNQ